jgi:hypothetical protein
MSDCLADVAAALELELVRRLADGVFGAGSVTRQRRQPTAKPSTSAIGQTGAGFLRAKASWRWYGKCG